MATDPVLDIKKSSALPYWFFAAGAILFCGMSWLARGVDAWVWIAVGIFTVSLAFVLAACFVIPPERKSADWFRNLHRLAWFAMIAALGGFLIRVVFASGTVLVENATPLDVRLVVDGNTWLELPARSTRKVSLASGSHVISVFAPAGGQKLDEHPAIVAGCGNYILNVFGAQTYLQGEVIYGAADSPQPKIIRDKWFEVETVDYFFKEPPKEITVLTDRGAAPRMTRKTYFLRAEPIVPRAK